MKADYSFIGTVEKFPGVGGWTYVAVPKKYTAELKKQRRAWGMYPPHRTSRRHFVEDKTHDEKRRGFFCGTQGRHT